MVNKSNIIKKYEKITFVVLLIVFLCLILLYPRIVDAMKEAIKEGDKAKEESLKLYAYLFGTYIAIYFAFLIFKIAEKRRRISEKKYFEYLKSLLEKIERHLSNLSEKEQKKIENLRVKCESHKITKADFNIKKRPIEERIHAMNSRKRALQGGMTKEKRHEEEKEEEKRKKKEEKEKKKAK